MAMDQRDRQGEPMIVEPYSPWGPVAPGRDAYTFSIDFDFRAKCFRRPLWWRKMRRWPLTWVLQGMIWLRLTGLEDWNEEVV